MTPRLRRALDALRARHGVDIGQSTVLRARLEHAIAGEIGAAEIGAHSSTSGIAWSDDAIDALARRLRIGATRFHRDPAQDLAIGKWMAKRRDHLGSVLSAGCSTGEEAFTLAMLAADARADWSVTAIDVSPEAIAHARAATYSIEAKGALPLKFRRHFVAGSSQGSCVVAPDIRGRVKFSVGDALRITFADRFQLIVCRNVAIYLAPESAERMLRRLADHLVEDGLLVVARAEVAIARRSGLHADTIGPGGPVAFAKAPATKS